MTALFAPRPEPSLADLADKHSIYQLAVQSPETDIELMHHIYRHRRNSQATHLREDFCGTGLTLSHWIAQGPDYSGEGFDIDADPVSWGQRNNLDPLGAAASRATLHIADARTPSSQPPDIRCAFNFSYWVFQRRELMLEYFRGACNDLADNGMLVLDATGGTDSLSEDAFESEFADFSMIWQQRNFNPIDHTADLTLTFCFPDGSRIDPPYGYRWRVWSVPEIADLLKEAGFQHIDIWWQDDEIGGIGYVNTRRGHNDPCWVVCIAAFK